MPSSQNTQISGTTRRRLTIPDSVTTTNNTPTVAFSFVLPEGTALYIRVDSVVCVSDFSAAGFVVEEAVFRRQVGGNVVRATTGGGAALPLIRSLNDFSGSSPSMDIIADVVTQSIQIKITGKASTTLKWQFQRITLRNIT